MSLKVKQIEWSRDKEGLLSIERSAFGDIASDERDLLRQIEKGFGFIAFDRAHNPLGYTIALPLEEAPYRGCTEDRSLGKLDTAYIESLAVIEGSSPATLLKLTRTLGNEFENRGYKRMTMHVESGSKLHRALSNLGARELGNFDNWMGWGRTFSYLEMPLEDCKRR
jgi:hypothetical protein